MNIIRSLKQFAGASMLLAAVSAAQAGNVTVWGETLQGFSQSSINNFYNSLPGHTSTIASGQLNTVNLSTTNLLWATQPADAYTSAELSTMATFLAGGGRIAFLGEHGTFAPAENARINVALAALGATMTIKPNVVVDSGFRSASVGDGQILSHPLTAGVNTYEYAAFDPILISGSAVALMVGEDSATDIMMAYQNIGPGSIFMITDQNVWDHASTGWPGGFNNARMFENLLSASTVQCGTPGAPDCDVPVPGSMALLALGLAGFVVGRRKFSA
jgi:PEP-CTERM motif